MAILTPDSINLLILIMGIAALVFILVYILLEGGGTEDEEDES